VPGDALDDPVELEDDDVALGHTPVQASCHVCFIILPITPPPPLPSSLPSFLPVQVLSPPYMPTGTCKRRKVKM
jgi:hypothetical protein